LGVQFHTNTLFEDIIQPSDGKRLFTFVLSLECVRFTLKKTLKFWQINKFGG